MFVSFMGGKITKNEENNKENRAFLCKFAQIYTP